MKGTVTLTDIDYENGVATIETESVDRWELDGLDVGESHTETFSTPWGESSEDYFRIS